MISFDDRFLLALLIGTFACSGQAVGQTGKDDKPRFIESHEWGVLVELRKVELLIEATEQANIGRTNSFAVRRGKLSITVSSEVAKDKRLAFLNELSRQNFAMKSTLSPSSVSVSIPVSRKE